LCHDPAQVREQLAGRVLTRAQLLQQRFGAR
jgi:hypothetical protein